MKKIIGALSVMVFSLCVLSCGNEKSDENNNSHNQETRSQEKGQIYESEGYIERGEWAN
jgi:hypothetical protein